MVGRHPIYAVIHFFCDLFSLLTLFIAVYFKLLSNKTINKVDMHRTYDLMRAPVYTHSQLHLPNFPDLFTAVVKNVEWIQQFIKSLSTVLEN